MNRVRKRRQSLGLKFMILCLSLVFYNADCNHGFTKTRIERFINGVQGFSFG